MAHNGALFLMNYRSSNVLGEVMRWPLEDRKLLFRAKLTATYPSSFYVGG
jgi:predicted ATPase with chaperone activity